MYCVAVRFETDPADQQVFQTRLRRQAEDSLQNEAGCLRFDVWTDPGKPGIFFLYEIYNNREAFDLHRETGHYRGFQDDIAGMVVAKHVDTWENGP